MDCEAQYVSKPDPAEADRRRIDQENFFTFDFGDGEGALVGSVGQKPEHAADALKSRSLSEGSFGYGIFLTGAHQCADRRKPVLGQSGQLVGR